MTTFQHDDASPADIAWQEGPLGETPWLEPPMATDHVVVVAAHPDDETLGAGGLIALAHRRGANVTVVVASDGEASHPGSSTHTPAALAERRRGEVQHAVLRLAPGASVHFLGLPDGRLSDYVDALTAQIEYFARTATHLACPWEGDRHPDHAACADAAITAARQHHVVCWQYPIWAWHWADPADSAALPWSEVRRLALGPAETAAKRDAIDAHTSQHRPLSALPGDEPIILPDMIAHFERPFETFVATKHEDATTPGYFDRLYSGTDDPWQLGTRFYEVRKRALLLDSLPRPTFGRAFEPGCATGLLTAELAKRCEQVVAWDVADRAVEQTSKRFAHDAAVSVARGVIPHEWPPGEFDLVVLSEVGYYCRDLEFLARRAWGSLSDDGVLVACHWRHPAADHPHTAESVHDALDRSGRRVSSHLEADFRLDVWTASGRSVAVETGIVT